MKYTYTTPEGIKEDVQLERWGWLAIYTDGRTLRQFGEDGTFHRFAEIEQDPGILLAFCMERTDGKPGRIDIPVPADGSCQIFHFYRHYILNHDGSHDGGTRVKVYAFGWKDRETGRAFYHYILPDDRLIVSPVGDLNIAEAVS